MLTSRIFPLIATLSRLLQWTSAIIVLGIVAWFVAHYEHDAHLIYQLVIAALMVVLYLPAVALPFMGTSGGHLAWYWPVDFVFSYLWLTSSIFAAQDYNPPGHCALNAPNNGGSCAVKKASESFIFLAFFSTILALVTGFSARDTTTSTTAAITHPSSTSEGTATNTAAANTLESSHMATTGTAAPGGAGNGVTHSPGTAGHGMRSSGMMRAEKYDTRASGDTGTV